MGTLIVVAGPSQSGKTTLMELFLKHHSDAARVVTTTSRPQRPEETNGVDRHFVSREFFTEHTDAFIEHVEEHGNYYGITTAAFEKALSENTFALIDVDFRGVKSIASYCEGKPIAVVFLFVSPNTLEEVERRIRLKADANCDARIASAQYEFAYKDAFSWDAVIDTTGPADENYPAFERAILQKVSSFKE